MPKGILIELGRCGLGVDENPPTLRMVLVSVTYLPDGWGAYVTKMRAALGSVAK